MMLLYTSEAVTMVTKHLQHGYLGDEVNERLSSQLLDPLCVETGQVVRLGLPLRLAAAVKSPVFCKTTQTISELNAVEYRWSTGGVQVKQRGDDTRKEPDLQKESASYK